MALIGWAATYLGIVSLAVVAVARRGDATIFAGRTLGLFNVAFVVVAAAVTFGVRGDLRGHALLAGLVLLLPTWAVRTRWLLVGETRRGIEKNIEACLRRLCATFERTIEGYNVVLAGTDVLHIRIRHLGTQVALLEFRAPMRHRKVELIQKLLGKQYRGLLPVLRIGHG